MSAVVDLAEYRRRRGAYRAPLSAAQSAFTAPRRRWFAAELVRVYRAELRARGRFEIAIASDDPVPIWLAAALDELDARPCWAVHYGERCGARLAALVVWKGAVR